MSEKDDTMPTVQPVVDGGAAFPTPLDGQVTRYDKLGNVEKLHPGMTLRDYFAAKAMEMLMKDDIIMVNEVAMNAYEIADAMLKERSK